MTTPSNEAIGYTPTAHNLMEAWEVPGKRLREAETQATSAIERQREAQRAVAQIKAEALREAADAAGNTIACGDVAECAAFVDGESGRQSAIDARDALHEDPEAWLRARAATIEDQPCCTADGDTCSTCASYAAEDVTS